ncbi:mannose-1-phosphate guanylyltransferase/mannose-6-phosphate isomerase [Paracoccus sp. S-4012]|uniref:mannose-1-phosphate guanylyltransferase/mannose-6-phosphate isomerase n=1 Tax=Paracoccus sp. S-4012 TaxID=2665648 RepID=UPI0012B10B60|nr:mannose-1-phosphate guanylyltransferase/mannose-6-phosphate isomerase [Paracoccus sp. S-4012]MRX51870.1 mannose-1-phosphate guanylyltransferase/mannose-6-phosphate isomerase [Paracoccus sp. S-4012]
MIHQEKPAAGAPVRAGEIVPVLLSGGSGTRLWPLSRRSFPKQFAAVLPGGSLFQKSAQRLSGPAFASPVVVTSNDFRFIVTEQLAGIGVDPAAVLVEPEARNTAPAILAAALFLAERDPRQLMIVAPSDHVVPDAEAFRATLLKGIDAARKGRIVTFGVRPDRAETGYGYLEIDHAAGVDGVWPLRRFVEKPDRLTAQSMIEDGGFLWNAGIFLFEAGVAVAAFEEHAPDLVGPVRNAVAGGQHDLGFLRLDPAAFGSARSVSIDYAVMEAASNLAVVPFEAAWSDLGDWSAVATGMGEDADGVACGGSVTAIDCRDTLLRSESEGVELVGLGLENIVAVVTDDAVLVADRSRAQEVRRVIEVLSAKGARQATSFLRDHRPWGWFETLALGGRFQVKRIVVNPGAALSLQSHVHRSEHWIVVSGTAEVTVGETVRLLTENESVYIPLGAIHRLSNPGKLPMVLIEVQTGAYLGEDDITRYEDRYARG